MRRVAASLGALALATACSPGATTSSSVQAAPAGDAAAGKQLFAMQCLLCHTAEPGDGGGAQGPSLAGVTGRAAAAAAGFTYTPALRGAGLTWTAASLDRFLAAPTEAVPGTAMVNAVPDAADRANVIAYLATTAPAMAPSAASQTAAATGAGDWRQDAPGVRHRIDIANLPPPGATDAARNFPQMAPKPAGAELKVPPGFSVAEYATGFQNPRRMIQAANGDVFVAENSAGRIKIIHPSADGSKAESVTVYADGLRLPFGMLFYPSVESPQWLYVAEGDKVVRFPYAVGDQKASAEPEVVIPEIPSRGGHNTRDIAFSLDGETLYVSVGSGSNIAEGMPAKSVEEAQAWDAQHGATGAAWGAEERRAAVLAYKREGDQTGRIFATGIRNCVRLTTQPDTGDLWCTTNERDMLGDDLVPDYSTTVKDGGYYGWPWYYYGSHEDPRLAGQRPDLAGKALIPDVPYTSHSAAVELQFYQKSDGPSAFPDEYVGDGFAVHHGSWNRGPRTGGKVVRVLMENGKPTGEYEDFLTGFVIDDGHVWGRPSHLAQLQDGSLLLSDDQTGVIYRISHSN